MEVMHIERSEDWNNVLRAGAVVLWESKLFKIFQMPDGTKWRALSKWRMAWRVYD